MAKIEELEKKMQEKGVVTTTGPNTTQPAPQTPVEITPLTVLDGTCKRPTRCRVKLTDKMFLPIVGSGVSAFDAHYDWDRMVAYATVEGHLVAVGLNMGVFVFYKD